ncbi:MAG: ABC transporter ATP-binding protein [Lapillicoccus sp.]
MSLDTTPPAPVSERETGRNVQPLTVDDLTVRFGGIVALSEVGFTVASGSIHALIGPNGAGKSTCFNAITGIYRPTSGQIRLGDTVLTNTPAHRIASLGIGRAFQNLALVGTSSVLDNVMLGRYSLTSGGFLSYGLRLPWTMRSERRHQARAAEICDFLGIAAHLHKPAGILSYGDQKRVDIARALAVEPTILLLDEPAAGMNSSETAGMAQLILDIRNELGISILLVEHDMGLVMGIADRVTVLDFGRLIADDVPDVVQQDPAVIRAYLGAEVDEPDPAAPTTPTPPPAPPKEGTS